MIQKLPEEVLTIIIDYTGSCHAIAQCRTVCKHWNMLVEPLMFSKQITIKSDQGALSLFSHLAKRRQYGNRIKYLKFPDYEIEPVVLGGLLSLAFTPSMVRMEGNVNCSYFYYMLKELAEQRPGKFSKLEAIPKCYINYGMENPAAPDEYYMALLVFKDTLQEIALFDLENISSSTLNQLQTFKNLKALCVEDGYLPLSDLENILKGFSGLGTVSLLNVELHDRIQPQEEWETYYSTSVKVDKTVKRLILNQSCPYLLEYLVFKYPNINAIEINDDRPLDRTMNSFQRIFKIIKKISNFKVSLGIPELHFYDVIKHLNDDSLPFIYENYASSGLHVLKIDSST